MASADQSGKRVGDRRAPQSPQLDDSLKRALLDGADSFDAPLVELGQRLGVEGLEVVLEVLGGLKPHIPQAQHFWGRLWREHRDAQIRAAFDGRNYEALAQRFDLDVRYLREIIHHRHRRHAPRPQEAKRPVKVCAEIHETVGAVAAREGVSMGEALGRILAQCLAEQRR